jgi:hypothetical protein
VRLLSRRGFWWFRRQLGMEDQNEWHLCRHCDQNVIVSRHDDDCVWYELSINTMIATLDFENPFFVRIMTLDGD